MKLLEVVMLVGAQCVSPIEPSHLMTSATKVPCAVLVAADEASGRITVTPAGAAADPQVMRAITRITAAVPPVPRAPVSVTARPSARVSVPPPTVSADTPHPPRAEPKAVAASAPPPPEELRKPAALPKRATKPSRVAPMCKGTARARWYRTADGGRHYRCAAPTASRKQPIQLY